MSTESFNLLSFKGKMKVLHMSWIAFFITFFVWFNHAPMLQAIANSLGLAPAEVKTLLILNVALTIPARIIIGMLTDRFGPKIIYSGLLALCSIPCFMFAMADSFTQAALARFLLGFIGAGFVIGIRLVSEWFPANELGTAEGVYGGWGNFGSAAAAFCLPALALAFGADDGWRYAIGLTGVISLLFSVVFYKNVSDTPKGSTYFKPKKSGGLEVTSWGDLWFYLAMNIPMYIALAVLTWKLSPSNLGLLTDSAVNLIYIGLVALYLFQASQIWKVNHEHLKAGVPEMQRYKFKQVAILDWSYFVTFGSELAVVSMLPLFFLETFEGLDPVKAGMLASGFAFMNLIARPSGGWFSDHFGRRKTMMILICGLAVGYFMLSQVNGGWWIPLAVIATMCCSFFVQAGEGAVFAMVPLVQRRMTGQIAGMAGAYGNVGAVTYLTALSFVDYNTFFLLIAASAGFIFLAVLFLEEPAGKMAEVLPDGTVELIDVT